MQSQNGFDNASADRAKDYLDRWRFALDVAEAILTTPVDWSVRVGLFGGWGTGKSTVLRYLQDTLEQRGSIVINFNPSFESSLEDLTATFGSLLINKLSERSIYVEPKFKRVLRRATWLRSGTVTNAATGLLSLGKVEKIASAGFGALSAWLNPTGDQIKKISAELPEQRLVVLIDDLDRTPQNLLPHLLLSLREILDLPRFSFVLAFDDKIVSSSLKQQNEAWGDGQEFIEKILDFRFALPPLDKHAKRSLLSAAILDMASFVPLASLDEVEDMFPNNPRQLKALIRGIRALQPIIERHKSDEVTWTDIWLVQLLKQESSLLVSRLNDGTTFDDILGYGHRFLSSVAERGNNGTDTPDKTSALLDELGLAGGARDRVNELLNAMRSRSSHHLQYVIGWSLRPPAVTWKEFDDAMRNWKVSRSSATLADFVNRQARIRSDSVERVYEEMVNAFSGRYDEQMNNAVGHIFDGDLREAYSELALTRKAFVDFLSIPGELNPDRFKTVYQKALYWSGLRRPGPELDAREAELADLERLSRLLSDVQAQEVYEAANLGDDRPSFTLNDEATQSRSAIRNEVRTILEPIVRAQLLALLPTDGFGRRLREPKRLIGFKRLLFPKTGQWDLAVRTGLLDLFASALREEIAYQNAYQFTLLLVDALQYRSSDIEYSRALQVITDDDLMSALWHALISRPLVQYGPVKLLAMRQKFLDAGASESRLAIGGQLESFFENFIKNKDEVMNAI